MNILLAIVLTLISGLCDAFGFVHASRVWSDERLVRSELALAVSGFGLGAVSYVMVIRYLNRLGVTAPELQTLGWFAVTVFGVALIQRTLVEWSSIDRVIGVVAVLAVGWLVVRHG